MAPRPMAEPAAAKMKPKREPQLERVVVMNGPFWQIKNASAVRAGVPEMHQAASLAA
ncbi:hypothetical protein LHK_00479 [Laribacter hongkongensis HLHK9]|uniref:Uncharacterized protein n=2 Tax=Laribacter hongkongensis TaxID=168471 RepID=C1DC56_LARHH|nr:hypothetical protein LHK_00479 [Laribacter hongkongensis HLHK9]ASJ23302.1 hypothetical protein LHGZ1_0471 [Laribacter hongkongensis]